jgi:hypothetical protein
LPLPTQTGEAIADYLSHGRPTVFLRTVFVHTKRRWVHLSAFVTIT